MTFGERLRQLRRDAGLSQGELAGDDLSASYISLLEADKRSPSSEVMSLLAARLGCSTSQLSDGTASERDQRIELEMAYAKLAIEHGESGDARARLENLLSDDGIPLAVRDEATLLLGTSLERLGEHLAAVQLLGPLLDRACARQSNTPVIQIGLDLCRAYLDAGSVNRAAVAGEKALAAARDQGLAETNEYFRLAATVMAAFMQAGDFVHARAWANSLIAQAEASGQVAGQAVLYWNSALLAEQEGRLEEAVKLSEWALSRLSELDNLRDYARLRLALAHILLGMDQPDVHRADDLLDRLLPDLRDLGSRFDLGLWNREKSAVLLHRGDASAAEGRARQALDLLAGARPREMALAHLTLHDALSAQARLAEAGECLSEAFRQMTADGTGRASAPAWRELAERMAEAGDATSALAAYGFALDAASIRDRSAHRRSAAAVLRSTPLVAVQKNR